MKNDISAFSFFEIYQQAIDNHPSYKQKCEKGNQLLSKTWQYQGKSSKRQDFEGRFMENRSDKAEKNIKKQNCFLSLFGRSQN